MTIEDFDLELNAGCSWDHLTLEEGSRSTRFCGYLDQLDNYAPHISCSPNYIRTVDENSKRMECVMHTSNQVKLQHTDVFKLKFFSDHIVQRRGFNISLSPVDDEPGAPETTKTASTVTTANASSTVTPFVEPPVTSPSQSMSDSSTTQTMIPNTYSTTISKILQTLGYKTGSQLEPSSTSTTTTSSQETTTSQTLHTHSTAAVPSSTSSKSSSTPSPTVGEPITFSSTNHKSSSPQSSSPLSSIVSTLSSKSLGNLTESSSMTNSAVSISAMASTTAPQFSTPQAAQPQSACSGGEPLLLEGVSGYIESPGYKVDSLYPPNTHCKWIIKNPKEQVRT